MIRERDLRIEISNERELRIIHEPSGLTGIGIMPFPSSRWAARNEAIRDLVEKMHERDMEPHIYADLYTSLAEDFNKVAKEVECKYRVR